MSRRYGRNQKRRARAEIAQLEQKSADLQAGMAMDRALLAQQSRRLNVQERTLKNVAMVLGTNFIGLEPALLKFRDAHQMKYLRYPVDGGDVMMHTLQARIQAAPDRPDYMLHFRAELDGEQVGYTVSECALRDGELQYMVQKIAEEMAIILIRGLREKYASSLSGFRR